MSAAISTHYLERLCEIRDYDGLAWICAVLSGSDRFNADDPTYGFPDPAFNFLERLAWFAQGTRSGAWTYFEATPPARQHAMLSILRHDTHHADFSAQYAFGMENWKEPSSMKALDEWLDANDDRNNALCWQIICSQRDIFQRLTDHS